MLCAEQPVSKNNQCKNNQRGTVLVYVVFLAIAVYIYKKIANGEFSSVLTIAAIFQCLAFSLLGVQVFAGSCSGISVKSLQLDAFAFVCRLSSTTVYSGYIPLDATGDYLYQFFDACSLIMAIVLIYRMLKAKGQSQETEDGLPAIPFVVVCALLACVLHADLNDHPIFDSAWMTGHFVNTIAVVPQLWLLAHRKASVPALTAHFVAVMGVSRILTGTYMWRAYDEITCDPWFGKFNHAAPSIVGADFVHLILLGDFAYYYVRNIAESGLKAPLQAYAFQEV